MQKRQLEVEITLIRRVRHGPHCGAQIAITGGLQIGFQIQRFNNFQAVGIHYLKHPLPLGRIQQVLAQQSVSDAAQQLAVQRGVHGTDTGVIDALAILGVDIFMGRVTGRELALLFTGFHIENMDHVAGGGGYGHLGAIRRQCHVIGTVAVHLKTPDHLTGGNINGGHIRIAGAGNDQQAAVIGAVHIIHVLVMTFANEHANPLEEHQVQGVHGNGLLPLGLVRYAIDAPQSLVSAGINHIDHAFPVITHENHLARPRGLRLGGRLRRFGVGHLFVRHLPTGLFP